MKRKTPRIFMALLAAAVVSVFSLTIHAQKRASEWKVHDRDRKPPDVVTPGDKPWNPPSDAIILFKGDDLSQWRQGNNKPAGWKVENGYMEVTQKTGSIVTAQSFGDCQLLIEWASPEKVIGSDQGRGNSGIKFMGKYELQVLDSEILGDTSGVSRGYHKHADKLPLQLQDHSHPVRYRNIWIRELPEQQLP